MFRFHIQGLCIAVREKSCLRVVMLNSAARRTLVPFHIQSVFAAPGSVRFELTTVQPLPSIRGRWLTTASDEKYVGWSIIGSYAMCGRGSAPKRPASRVDAIHPVPVGNPDWSDLHWVLNASRFLPKGKLKEEFKILGPDISTIIEFRGGRLEGGRPVDTLGSQFVWHIRDGYEQAITDTIDVVFDGAPPSLTIFNPVREVKPKPIRDAKLKRLGRIVWAPHGEAWLVNDATEIDARAALSVTANNRRLPSCDDSKLFLEAFDAPKSDKDAVAPRAVRNFASRKLFTGPHCAALMVE